MQASIYFKGIRPCPFGYQVTIFHDTYFVALFQIRGRSECGGGATLQPAKTLLALLKVNNELPINLRPICGSTRLAFRGSFILALSLSFSSICQPALLTSPTTRSPAYTQKRGRIPKSPPGFFKSKKKLLTSGKSSAMLSKIF